MGDNYTWFQGEEGDDFGSGGPTHYESDKDEDERIEDKLNEIATARSLPFDYQQRKNTTPVRPLAALTRSNLDQFDVQQQPSTKNVIWKNVAVRGRKEGLSDEENLKAIKAAERREIIQTINNPKHAQGMELYKRQKDYGRGETRFGTKTPAPFVEPTGWWGWLAGPSEHEQQVQKEIAYREEQGRRLSLEKIRAEQTTKDDYRKDKKAADPRLLGWGKNTEQEATSKWPHHNIHTGNTTIHYTDIDRMDKMDRLALAEETAQQAEEAAAQEAAIQEAFDQGQDPEFEGGRKTKRRKTRKKTKRSKKKTRKKMRTHKRKKTKRRKKTRKKRRRIGKNKKQLKRLKTQYRRFRIAKGDKRFKGTKGLVKWSSPSKAKRKGKRRSRRIYHRKRR